MTPCGEKTQPKLKWQCNTAWQSHSSGSDQNNTRCKQAYRLHPCVTAFFTLLSTASRHTSFKSDPLRLLAASAIRWKLMPDSTGSHRKITFRISARDCASSKGKDTYYLSNADRCEHRGVKPFQQNNFPLSFPLASDEILSGYSQNKGRCC